MPRTAMAGGYRSNERGRVHTSVTSQPSRGLPVHLRGYAATVDRPRVHS
jgi:hypothetical protein